MRTDWKRWVAASALCLAFGANADSQSLRLDGAAAIGRRLAPALLDAFAAESASAPHPTVTIDDTAAGLAALAAGRAHLAMVDRRPTDDERVLLLRAGIGDPAAPANTSVVALEAIAIVVNRDNAISILTIDQIRRLFTGQIHNWSALGGRNLPVTIYRQDGDAADAFAALALGHDPIAATASLPPDGKSLAEAVAADPGAIGFAEFGETGDTKPVTVAFACGITAPPTPFAVGAEEYPLSRRLALVASANKTALAQEFLQFAASAAAAPLVRRAGLINLTPTLAQPGESLPRPGIWEPAETKRRRDIVAHITQSLAAARRLSTTFRFEPDGTLLDPRAQADLTRIAAFRRANPGHKLILVGYANGPASFDSNLVLSAKHAQTVAAALAQAGAPPDQLLAGSSLRPIACNEDATPSARVEVWLR